MKKAFDAVQWMRDRRRQIEEEDRNLGWLEKRRKTHEIVMRDPLLAKLCRSTRPAESRPLAVRKESAPYRRSLTNVKASPRTRRRGRQRGSADSR